MKKILCCFILIALVVVKNKAIAQSANRSLSNLTSPTKINTDLLPDSGNTHNLGSAPRAWKNFFMKGAFFLDGIKFIKNGGIANTFIGSDAGKSNTSGYNNTALGYNAMSAIKNGHSNVAIGNAAMYNTDSGYYSVAIGDSALYHQSGFPNVANTAIGYQALFNNTTGYLNTAIGLFSLYNNTIGTNNIAIGVDGLSSNVSGGWNVALGQYALDSNVTGMYNTAVGNYTLHNLISGVDNSAFGYGAFVSDGASNSTALGGAGVYASNEVRIGGTYVTSIGGAVDWTTTSDGRVKRNIKQNIPGLAFINKLQPVTYNLDLDAIDKIAQRPAIKDKNGEIRKPLQSEIDARIAKQKIIYTGFIAQDVEKAAKSLSYDFSGVDAAKNDRDLYGLRYAEFVVPLVKAVQELSEKNDSLKNENNEIKLEVTNLRSEINELKTMIVSSQSTANSQQSTANISSALLQQNIPNPFTSSTAISYTLPEHFSSAKIIITDKNGNALKQINLSIKGNGSIQVDASTLSSGAYQYSLIVDGKLLSTKQMILSK